MRAFVYRKKREQPMNIQTETLCTELMETVRLSQRTVDHALKAHESGRPKYSQYACSGRDRLGCLNEKICCVTWRCVSHSDLSTRRRVVGNQLERFLFIYSMPVDTHTRSRSYQLDSSHANYTSHHAHS